MSQRLNPQTLRRLTYFAAIADAGSIREASRRLGLSVASVSEALSALEEELGTSLATRNTRRLRLTEEGRRVAGIADRMLDAGEELFVDGADPAEVTGGVTLTAPVEIAQSWLPRQLEVFKRKYPKVGISISASDLVVDLSQSPFDLAIRARFLPPTSARSGLRELPLTCTSAESLHLAPRDYGWFAPVTLLSHRNGDTLDVLDERSGRSRYVRFADVMVVDNKHVALAMVQRGMGAALVSKISADTIPGLCEILPEYSFGHIRLDIEMRDKRPSRAALALQSALVANGTD